LADRFTVPLDAPGRCAHVAFTDRHDGDFGAHDDPSAREALARRLVDLPWSWARQVHGNGVLEVREPGEGRGVDADGLVTDVPGAVLSVRGADCPMVVLVAREGVIGVAHAGWRGLVGGVLEATVAAMRRRGAACVQAYLGPCITAAHYEFGPDDLAHAKARLGDTVVGATTDGRPALDLPAGVTAALASVGVPLDTSHHRCTAADPALYSHRARREAGRHTAAVWLTEAPVTGACP
jgi:YfiH family protein